MTERQVVIVDGVRTAFGRMGGTIRDFFASQLGGIAVKGLLEKTKIKEKAKLDSVFMGTALGCIMGSIIQFFKVEPFIVTLMGLWFARGMAYIITLTSLTIKNDTYRYFALTKVPIPLFEKAGKAFFPSMV